MTARCDCAQAEMLAGAIALGEAGDAERDAYRAHLAICARCRAELAGEREIERVMAVATQARDAERWEPDVRRARTPSPVRRYAWAWAGGLAAVAVVALGIYQAQTRAVVVPNTPPVQASSEQAERAIAALNNQTAPQRVHQAESLKLGAPSAGTITFSVRVDERGAPQRCTVTKTSGNRELDAAVCRAAITTLRTRQAPTRQ